MPYTAPSSQQPSAHQIDNAPIDSTPMKISQPPSDRLHPSRSYSSAAYLRKHRRSPSVNKFLVHPTAIFPSRRDHVADYHTSLRQSPPPITDTTIPPGAMISPPESNSNSSDEDSASPKRSTIDLGDLEAAVRSIGQRRDASPDSLRQPDRAAVSRFPAMATRGDRSGRPADLLPSGKFSISDSPEDPFISSPDESDQDDDRPKPPMVRKKSGELVRPALRPSYARRRPSSMPGTPTYSKAVHFDSQLEHIRHFLQLDKPLAVSTETSPTEVHDTDDGFPFSHDASLEPSPQWELCLVNFPKNQSSRTRGPVRLETLSLSSDNMHLIGVVAVANLAFHKQVVARFTFDYWKTVSEVTGEYAHDSRQSDGSDGCDRFSFSIKLADQANLGNKTMLICIRYSVGGKEYWDNNDYMNYQVTFSQSSKLSVEDRVPSAVPRVPLPRSRAFACSHTSRPHSMPPSFDDFSDVDSYLTFGSIYRADRDFLSRTVSHDIEPTVPVCRDKQSRQAFGNRYDFGASLSAAIRAKPAHDRTAFVAQASSRTGSESSHSTKGESLAADEKSAPSDEAAQQGVRSVVPTKSASLLSDKPRHESVVYKELVDKYCFYGSPGGSSKSKRRPTSDQTDLATLVHNPRGRMLPSPSVSPVLSPHSDSPSTSASPASQGAGYPYHQSMQNFFLKESQTSTAIRG